MTGPDTALGEDESIELVLFSMLGRWAGLVAGQVAPLHSDASHSGAVAVETLAGMSHAQTMAPAKRVLLNVQRGSGAGVDVSVNATAALVRIPIAAVHPLPLLLRARHQLNGLRALGWIDDGRDDPLVLLFDWCTPEARRGA